MAGMGRKANHRTVAGLAGISLGCLWGAFLLGNREPKLFLGLCIATVTFVVSFWYGVMRTRRAEMLSNINREIAKAEKLTVARGDDDTLQRTSKVLGELKERRREVETELRGEKNT
jgi:hypothetical protein